MPRPSIGGHALALCLLLGCRSSPSARAPNPSSPKVESSVVATALEAPAISEASQLDALLAGIEDIEPLRPLAPAPYSGAEALALDDDGVPAFARLDFEPQRLVQRAYLDAPKVVYTPSRLKPLARPGLDGESHAMVTVLADDAGESSRRPRLLCDASDYRFSVAVDASGLAVAAATTTHISPVERGGGATLNHDPIGLTIGGGTLVEVLDRSGTQPRVRFQGRAFGGEGFVDASDLDVTFVWSSQARRDVLNAIVDEDAKVLDVPAGRSFGRVGDTKLRPTALGPKRDGHRLVQLQDASSNTLVGWVAQDSVRGFVPLDKQVLEEPVCGGVHSGPESRSRHTAARRGDLLRAVGSDEVVGVVTRDGELECVARCRGTRPRVRLIGCWIEVDLELDRQ